MPKKFLVIRWSGMGDIIMTLPAIKRLKEHYPDSSITYLTDSRFIEIPLMSGLVDKVFGVDRNGFKTPGRFPGSFTRLLLALSDLRRIGPDLVFDLQGFGETALIARLTGCVACAGRVKASALRRRLYTIHVSADWVNQHRCLYFLKMVCRAAGLEPAGKRPLKIPFARKADKRAANVGLNIGASTESRRWSEENFIHVARRLGEKGFKIRFFLGPDERFLKRKVEKACLNEKWDIAATESIDDLVENLSGCRLLISNDTGPGHLAAAMEIPVITLFSTGDPENVAPVSERGAWFRNRNDINMISPEEVVRTALRILG